MAGSKKLVGIATVLQVGVAFLVVVGQVSPKPLFLLHGAEDKAVHYSQSQRLFDSAGEPKQLWVLDGARHTTLLNKAPEEYERRVLGF